MTVKELLAKLITQEGPCMRLCSYCPEEYVTRELKECVESLYRDNLALKQTNDELLTDYVKLRNAYKEATGHDYMDS